MKNNEKTWVEISGSALRSNVREIRRFSGDSLFMAVVKSNAYGHGISSVVSSVDSLVDWYGVDSLGEANQVREAGSRRPILILGFTPEGYLPEVVRRGYHQVVYSLEIAKKMNSLSSSGESPARVHVKVETGTSRQGVPLNDLPAFMSSLSRLSRLRVEGLYTHFANAEDTDDVSHTELQLDRFLKAVDVAKGACDNELVLHTACSAAALLYSGARFSLVRVGISLYGLWSSEGVRKTLLGKGRSSDLKLEPVLSWKTRIVQIKELAAGTPVGYGLTEKAKRDSRVAVIPVGYWDGFDRGLSSVGEVLVRGRRAKVLGRICMNMCMIDVTDVENVREDDEVVLLGGGGSDRISAEEIAARIDTINYEVVTRINPLLPRLLVR